MTNHLDELLDNAAKKDRDGTLTIQDTILFGYYRLLDGPHAGRIVIKTSARIYDEFILYFADHLTWTWAKDLATTRCQQVHPTFPRVNTQGEASS